MTLDDLERQNRDFCGFFGDFELRSTFQMRIAPKSIVIHKEELHVKFSALNVYFDSSSFHHLGPRKLAHDGIKERYPVKVIDLPLLVSLS